MSLEDKVKELELRLAALEAALQALQSGVQQATLPSGPPDPGKQQ